MYLKSEGTMWLAGIRLLRLISRFGIKSARQELEDSFKFRDMGLINELIRKQSSKQGKDDQGG